MKTILNLAQCGSISSMLQKCSHITGIVFLQKGLKYKITNKELRKVHVYVQQIQFNYNTVHKCTRTCGQTYTHEHGHAHAK